jgi:alpha-L-fucosidase 2
MTTRRKPAKTQFAPLHCKRLLLTIFVLALVLSDGISADQPLSLWYRRPATRWLESLPVGNGRLGAVVFDGVEREKLGLNESTVWSGAPS